MTILSTPGWADYQLLDTGDGRRLERFGKFTLSRPDPQILWGRHLPQTAWDQATAIFTPDSAEHGNWKKRSPVPDKWELCYKNLSFFAKLGTFKHLGIFPEQQLNWDWIREKIEIEKMKTTQPIKVLNLFGYTGIATLAAAGAGAQITHVDASKSTIAWARENQQLSHLSDKPIRWICEDVMKFCTREQRRGSKYDAIIMDPPIYGHGPEGETWKFSSSFPKLLATCKTLLTPNPLFFLVNAYAISASAVMLSNMLTELFPHLGVIESGELALQEKSSPRLLSTGIFARFSR